MHRIVCHCPSCLQVIDSPLTSSTEMLVCPSCQSRLRLTAPPDPQGGVDRCLVCPSRELFVRKDFPQKLGLNIAIAGFIASSVAWYFHQVVATFAILLGMALADLVLYLVMGDVLECYACHAQYRGVKGLEEHSGFDLEIHERHRQRRARLAEAHAATPGQGVRPAEHGP